MVNLTFSDIFKRIKREHAAMRILQQFCIKQKPIARAAEAIRDYVVPIQKNHDGWVKYPDGRSRPGMSISREILREHVRQKLKKHYSEEVFQKALTLTTVNSRARAKYFFIWKALQDLVAGEARLSEKAHFVRHYFDLLLLWTNDSLQTAITDNDPLFLDSAVFYGNSPNDLSSNHDKYLYGDPK